MADREIIIGGDVNGEGGLTLMRGTSVKESYDTNTDKISCFDEVVTQGAEKVGGTLEIEKLSYDSMDDYVALRDKLKEMLKTPTMVSTFETIRFKGETPYVIKKNFMDCILDSKDYEMKPEEHSTYGLKFIFAECKEEDPKQI